MKRLDRPDVKDVAMLIALGKNDKLASYPLVRQNLKAVVQRYREYKRTLENAAALGTLAPSALDPALKGFLKGFYLSPPVNLGPTLDDIRDSLSPDVCPMCGGPHPGTLEHVYPKTGYEEFSILTLNLVPGCTCNSRRDNIVVGPNVGERILHPYFDNILEQRLLRAKFTPDPNDGFRSPKIDLEILLTAGDPYRPAVEFHLQHVVEKSRIFFSLDKDWPKLLHRPFDYFTFPMVARISLVDFKAAAKETLRKRDNHYGTPNNWYSMLFAGIVAQDDVGLFFTDHINELIRQGVTTLNLYNT